VVADSETGTESRLNYRMQGSLFYTGTIVQCRATMRGNTVAGGSCAKESFVLI
jgi:hypothetical protein